ncbi:hypothetical protein [Rhodobium gokarnense]|uniref:Uncharacterized protein n=1 Tax=Rhodobium gokarnense TaxID=364296 RepID=A0ABT3HGP6_9HYPH|nr:hypothetical protein [Rhodobium gokarnense]MCW2309564.1 hypothetical protein [Rhodobium gokarnense]
MRNDFGDDFVKNTKKFSYIIFFILISLTIAVLSYFLTKEIIIKRNNEALTRKILNLGPKPTPLQSLFPDIEWDEFCRIGGYSVISITIKAQYGIDIDNYTMKPRDFDIEEGEIGIALINHGREAIYTYKINSVEISSISGPDCLSKRTSNVRLIRRKKDKPRSWDAPQLIFSNED